MTASDDGPATGSAPQRFGPDLWPRVAAAVAMGSVAVAATWIGGFLFAAFWWLASIVVLWEWQRLVGGERLIVARVVAGAVALALAASASAQQNAGISRLSAQQSTSFSPASASPDGVMEAT